MHAATSAFKAPIRETNQKDELASAQRCVHFFVETRLLKMFHEQAWQPRGMSWAIFVALPYSFHVLTKNEFQIAMFLLCSKKTIPSQESPNDVFSPSLCSLDAVSSLRHNFVPSIHVNHDFAGNIRKQCCHRDNFVSSTEFCKYPSILIKVVVGCYCQKKLFNSDGFPSVFVPQNLFPYPFHMVQPLTPM